MLLLYFVCLNYITYIFAKYNCASNASILLKYNEILFFETPSYPSLVNENEILNNNFTILVTQNSSSISRLTMILTVLIKHEPSVTYISFINASSINFQDFFRNEYGDANAIQGYAIFEQWKEDSCPFEAVSRNDSFQFTDNTELIFIQSAYTNQTLYSFSDPDSLEFSQRKGLCQWRFKSPPGYGFKVIITKSNFTENTNFIVENSTHVITNKKKVKENYPYYINDDYLEINLINIPNFAVQMELQIAVSIEKINVTKVDGNCLKTMENNKTIWYSIGYNSIGYENNIKCSHTEIITSEFEIIAMVELYCVEINADHLSYYYEDENICYDLSNNLMNPILLTHHENGSERVMHFEFESDGSVQALGFRLEFEKNYCTCNERIFHCDNRTHTIMKGTDYVCQYMKCNFSIESCKTEYTYLQIHHISDGDVFKIFSNGELVFDPSTIQPFTSDYSVFLNSFNQNYLEISTSFSTNVQEISINIYEYKVYSSSVDVILSLESPTYLMDTSNVKLATFALSESLKGKNTFMTIYGNDIPHLYNNKSLSINIAGTKCVADKNFIPYKCYIKDRKNFAIYVPPRLFDDEKFQYFAVTLSRQSGCILEENVFFLFSDSESSISSVATKKGPCQIIFYNSGNRFISHLWTNSKTENVQIFIGAGLKKLFLEFNSKTSRQWQRIWLTSATYTVIIPKGSSIFIKASEEFVAYHDHIYPSYKSIFATPESGIPFHSKMVSAFTYDFGDIYVKFTAIFYNVNSGNDFFLKGRNTEFRFNKAGDSLVLKNDSIEIYFYCKNYYENGVFLFIEALDEKQYRYSFTKTKENKLI